MKNKIHEMQMNLSLVQAQFWIARATTGDYERDRVGVGPLTASDHREMTSEEKRARAFEIANRHIEWAQGCVDAMSEAVSRE